MFENLESPFDAMVKSQQAFGLGIETIDKHKKASLENKEKEDKHREWLSPEQAESRKKEAQSKALTNDLQMASDRIKLDALNANPDLWRQHITSGIDLQVRENVKKMDQLDFDDAIRVLPLKGLKTVEDVAKWQKEVMTKLPAERAIKILGNMPSIQEMSENPYLIAELNMRMASQMYGAKERVASAQQSAKDAAANERVSRQEAGKNSRAAVAGAQRMAQIEATGENTRALQELRGSQNKDLKQMDIESREKIAQQKYEASMAKIKAEAKASGKQPEVRKVLNQTTESWMKTQVAPSVKGVIDAADIGLSKEEFNQLTADVSGEALNEWTVAASEGLDPQHPSILARQILDAKISMGEVKDGKYIGGDYKPRTPEKKEKSKAPTGKVKITKDGKNFYVPESQLQEAINQGYKKAD